MRLSSLAALVARILLLAFALGVAWTFPASAQLGPQYMVGHWLGPALGNSGQCGTAYAEFMFTQDGQFSYVQNTQTCGGVDGGGHYSADGQMLRMHFERCNTCAVYGFPPDLTEPYRIPDENTLMLCENWGCYTFHRQ
jgi:hypothetical protein